MIFYLDSLLLNLGGKFYYYQSRLEVLLGMWEKGKVMLNFRGGKMRTSWNQIAKETGRRDISLKQWNDLYEKNKDYDKYLKIAEKKAKEYQRGKSPVEIKFNLT